MDDSNSKYIAVRAHKLDSFMLALQGFGFNLNNLAMERTGTVNHRRYRWRNANGVMVAHYDDKRERGIVLRSAVCNCSMTALNQF